MSPSCPPVRYLAARDLNVQPTPDCDLQTLRGDVWEWEPLGKISRLQRKDGSFPPGQAATRTSHPDRVG